MSWRPQLACWQETGFSPQRFVAQLMVFKYCLTIQEGPLSPSPVCGFLLRYYSPEQWFLIWRSLYSGQIACGILSKQFICMSPSFLQEPQPLSRNTTKMRPSVSWLSHHHPSDIGWCCSQNSQILAFFFLFVCFFKNRVSLCNIGCPGNCSVD